MPKRPWNLVDMPVYSLATIDTNGIPNMNICTYVTPITMKPKQFVIGVLEDCKTIKNLEHNSSAILQILSQNQSRLVRKFGYTSGHDTNKLASMMKNIETGKNGVYYLQDCVAYIEVDMTPVHDAGDHVVYIGSVTSYGHGRIDATPLTLAYLREKKMIRA